MKKNDPKSKGPGRFYGREAHGSTAYHMMWFGRFCERAEVSLEKARDYGRRGWVENRDQMRGYARDAAASARKEYAAAMAARKEVAA